MNINSGTELSFIKSSYKKKVKKTIFTFWLLNIPMSVVLYVIYRMVIADTDYVEGNFLENVLQILDITLNLAYSFAFVLAILFCSLTIFLNTIDKIRNKFYLSLLTFIGIPSFCVVFLSIAILTDIRLYSFSSIGNLLNFSMIYLIFTMLEFLMFRRKIDRLMLRLEVSEIVDTVF